ncbi:MAG: flagellar FlbD family protein [Candidatus Kapaibacterium sp.]
MIKLTRIDGREIVVNADDIETVETSHDSTVSLKTGRKLIVVESADEIIGKVIEFRQKCFEKVLVSPDVKRIER